MPADNAHLGAIACARHWAVTQGTAETLYEPADLVSRAQMATFIVRVLERMGAVMEAPSVDHFDDDDGSAHETSINKLADLGVVGGRSPGTYAPHADVTRAQMAAFLSRAYDFRALETALEELSKDLDYFRDDDGHSLEGPVNKVAGVGISGGFSDGSYRPGAPVRRDQMASFLVRLLDLAVENGLSELLVASSDGVSR